MNEPKITESTLCNQYGCFAVKYEPNDDGGKCYWGVENETESRTNWEEISKEFYELILKEIQW